MLYLKKLGKSLGISIIILLGLTFIITLLNYINLIGIKIVNIFSYITPFISFFIGGLLLSKTSINKGLLERIKFGLVIIVLSFIFNYLAFDQGFNISNIILYTITIISSIIGSMIGINLKNSD